MINNKKRTREGSEVQYGPRLVGEILHDYLENSNEPLAVAYREQTTKAEEQGWHPNTHLYVDLKTLLRSDSKMKVGKVYQGILRRDVECDEFLYEEHFTFEETVQAGVEKRNPKVFKGKFITITLRSDGSPRLNLRNINLNGIEIDNLCLELMNEIRQALKSVMGKS